MALNWTTGELMRPAGCLPCCSGSPPTPSECSCALLIPPFSIPYADLTTAQTAITDQTANCIAYADYGGGDTAKSISASFDGTTITSTVHTEVSAPSLSLRADAYFSVSLLSGATLSIPFTLTTDGSPQAYAGLLNCTTGVEESTDTQFSGSGTLVVVAPADGEYVLDVRGAGTFGIVTSVDMAFTVTCDMVYWVNPVIALWDDSATTRNLWACPKLLLPPLTESSGDWYASCADAATAITDQVSNCVGYYGNALTGLTFVATDGGTSLVFSLSTAGPPLLSAGPFWGGVNAEAGQTLSFDSTGFTNGNVDIYDDTGTLIENLTGATTLTSSALPYTGRYTVKITINAGGIPSSCTATVTSSGTLSVNEIQARWDDGLTCAATLDCGDACP